MSLDDLRAGGRIVRALEPRHRTGNPVRRAATTPSPWACGRRAVRPEARHSHNSSAMRSSLHSNATWCWALPKDAPVDLAHMGLNPPTPDFVAQHGAWVPEVVERHRRARALDLRRSNVVSDAKLLVRTHAATVNEVNEVNGVRLLTDETAAAYSPLGTDATFPFGLPAELVAAAPPGRVGLGFMYGEMEGRPPSGTWCRQGHRFRGSRHSPVVRLRH